MPSQLQTKEKQGAGVHPHLWGQVQSSSGRAFSAVDAALEHAVSAEVGVVVVSEAKKGEGGAVAAAHGCGHDPTYQQRALAAAAAVAEGMG
jgi:hypothetical protein